jgi:hypothetical protein
LSERGNIKERYILSLVRARQHGKPVTARSRRDREKTMKKKREAGEENDQFHGDSSSLSRGQRKCEL